MDHEKIPPHIPTEEELRIFREMQALLEQGGVLDGNAWNGKKFAHRIELCGSMRTFETDIGFYLEPQQDRKLF